MPASCRGVTSFCRASGAAAAVVLPAHEACSHSKASQPQESICLLSGRTSCVREGTALECTFDPVPCMVDTQVRMVCDAKKKCVSFKFLQLTIYEAEAVLFDNCTPHTCIAHHLARLLLWTNEKHAPASTTEHTFLSTLYAYLPTYPYESQAYAPGPPRPTQAHAAILKTRTCFPSVRTFTGKVRRQEPRIKVRQKV